MMYTKSDLDELKKKIDMVTYLEERGVALRQTGSSYTGLCPVHNERTPSFHVKSDTQTFKCYGCGIAGDILSLVQAMDSLTFVGAVQELAAHAGVDLKTEEDPEYARRQRLYGILRLANQWFRRNYQNLETTHPAKQNLADRNLYEYSITDDTIGFAPSSGLIALMSERKITIDELVEVGLVRVNPENERPSEIFRNRLVWTITDIQGRPIGFSGRKIFDEDTGPKYINSPQTVFYNKSKTLLGLSDAKKTILTEQEVYVVEGQADVMAMKAAGFQNTVATCGTAFGTEHANLLLHLSALGKESQKFKIIFCFDGDAAGTKAAKSVYEKTPNLHLNANVIQFRNKEGEPTDPCDYRKDYGDVALESLLKNQQVNIVEFMLTEELKNWDLTSPEGQSGYLHQVRQILSIMTDKVQYNSYLRKLATWTGIPHAEISGMFANRRMPAPAREEQPQQVVAPATEQLYDPVEEKLLALTVQHPDEAKLLFQKYELDGSYFKSSPDLVQLLLTVLNSNNEPDLSDERIINLLHADIGLVENRTKEGAETIVKNYLRYRYSQEISALNRLNLDFTELLFKQENLKKYYHQK